MGPTVTRDTLGGRVGPSPGPGPLIFENCEWVMPLDVFVYAYVELYSEN